MAPSTSTLSASGSRKAPERVVPWRRAIQPSMPSVLARHRPQGEHLPGRVLGADHREQQRRDEQPDDRHEVGRRRPAPRGRRSARGRSSAHQVGPERRPRWRPSAKRARDEVVGTVITPSISGASRNERAMPGRSTSTLTRRTDELVTSRRGDRVLQLAELGETLVHQRPPAPGRRVRRHGCPPPREKAKNPHQSSWAAWTKARSWSWSSSVSPGYPTMKLDRKALPGSRARMASMRSRIVRRCPSDACAARAERTRAGATDRSTGRRCPTRCR